MVVATRETRSDNSLHRCKAANAFERTNRRKAFDESLKGIFYWAVYPASPISPGNGCTGPWAG